jgi:hypothetical protein
MIVVRNALSKASAIFHRVPTGDYGLTKWYEKIRAKKLKDEEIESADPQEEESADA